MGRATAASPQHSKAGFSVLLVALAAWLLLALPTFAGAAPITIDVTADANQSPVFTTFTDPLLLADPGVWHEFKWDNRAYPLLVGYTVNKSLPPVHVSATVPNGRYAVFANLYGQPSNSYKYYYSYSPGNPSSQSVVVGPQADCAEVELASVEVADGQFDIYFQKADATSGPDFYFGWAWVRLVPIETPVTSTPASSPWSLWLIGGVGLIAAAWGARRLDV